MLRSCLRSILSTTLALVPVVAFAGTVINTDDSGAGSLRQIIGDANPGDFIDFSIPGPAPHVITLTSGEIAIDKALLISGPGADQVEISGNDASRVFFVTEGTSVLISGLTIRNGFSEPNGGCIAAGGGGLGAPAARIFLIGLSVESCETKDGDGGGVTIGLNSPTIVQDSRFEMNDAGYWGGAIYTHSEMTVIGTVFTGNTSGENGGAFFTEAGAVVIDSQFLGNSTVSQGGALFNYRFSTWIKDSLFEGNTSGENGGAIVHQSDACTAANVLTISGSRITDNEAVKGGGILNTNGCAMRISDSMIDHNTSSLGAGIFVDTDSRLSVASSTIADNTAQEWGGGIFVWDNGAATLTNTTLSGNTAVNAGGGAIGSNTGTQIELSNVTVTDNTASSTGGLYGDPGSSFELRGTIVAGNHAGTAAGSDCSADVVASAGHNLVGQDTGCPTGGIGDLIIAPADVFTVALAALASNGGKGPTHALLVGSPAVDTGDPAGCKDETAATIATDQRGASRPLDGDGNTTADCDIGAFEAPAPAQVLADVDGDGTVQALTDGLLLLRYAFGFTGNSLINGAVAAGCKRCTGQEIGAYLSVIF